MTVEKIEARPGKGEPQMTVETPRDADATSYTSALVGSQVDPLTDGYQYLCGKGVPELFEGPDLEEQQQAALAVGQTLQRGNEGQLVYVVSEDGTLPPDGTEAIVIDCRDHGLSADLAIVTNTGVVSTTPFHDQLCDALRDIPGHKNVVLDNLGHFVCFATIAPSRWIDPPEVRNAMLQRAHDMLQDICDQTDSTLLCCSKANTYHDRAKAYHDQRRAAQ